MDELLLVQGMTPKLLYGIDWNRNGLIDLGEPDETTLEEFDVSDGSLNLGLVSYLTLDSREANISPDGLEKISVNMEDTEELRTLLEERFDDPAWTEAIISYRNTASQNAGQTSQNSVQGASFWESGTASNSASSNANSGTIKSLLDLVGGDSSPFSDDIEEMQEYLPILYDNLTTSDTPHVGQGRARNVSRPR